MAMETDLPARWWLDATLLAGFVALTAVVATDVLAGVDIAVRDWSDAHRPTPLRLLARLLNFLGSANLLAPILLAMAVVLAVRDRTVKPVARVLVTFAVGTAVALPIKILTDRAAPRSLRDRAVELFANDAGWSFPSGHVVNTLLWYPVLLLLLAHLLGKPGAGLRRLILVGPVVVVVLTVTYLAFHWLTDALAGLLLGGLLARLLSRVNWDWEAGRTIPVP